MQLDKSRKRKCTTREIFYIPEGISINNRVYSFINKDISFGSVVFTAVLSIVLFLAYVDFISIVYITAFMRLRVK